MDNIAQRQKKFIENFLKQSKVVMEFGFAYLFAHPELMPMMDCEMKKIRSMETFQKSYPRAKQRCQQIMRQAYINYVIKLTKLGFKYAKCNPEVRCDVGKFRKIFDEYDQLRKDCLMEEKKRMDRGKNPLKDNRKKPVDVGKCDDPKWDEIFKQINELDNKIDKVRESVESSKYATPCELKSSSDILKKFNARLENKLSVMYPCEFTSACDIFKQLNDLLEKKLRAFEMMKADHLNQQQQQYEKSKKSTRIADKPKKLADSDNDSSEVLISFEQFTKPFDKKPVIPRNMEPTKPRAGVIERHLVIPIQANDSPKITPRFCFKKSPGTANMQVDLKLMFEDGIMYRDKLVDGICIENALPIQNYRNKAK